MTIYLPLKAERVATNSIDIVDSHGRVICSCDDAEDDAAPYIEGDAGTILAKMNTDRRVPVATYVLYKEGAFCMIHSKEDKKWNFVGGKQKGPETMAECARRECGEEIGIHPVGGRFLGMYEEEPGWLVVAFIASTIHDPKLLEPDKHYSVQWVSLDDLPGEPRRNSAKIIQDLQSPWGRDIIKQLGT